MFGEHLKEARSLMEIKRYQNKYKHKKRSVAEHSWFVCKVSHGLAIWERDKFGNKKVNIEEVMFMAMNHDIVECYTGDILSTTKKLSPKLRSELLKVEKVIFKDIIVETLPNSWGDSYIDLNEKLCKLDCINSKIVKASDLLDRVFECKEEIDLGNTEPYLQILEDDLTRLFEMDIMSVNYFLKYSIKDIDAYKYIPTDIKIQLEEMDYSKYF